MRLDELERRLELDIGTLSSVADRPIEESGLDSMTLLEISLLLEEQGISVEEAGALSGMTVRGAADLL